MLCRSSRCLRFSSKRSLKGAVQWPRPHTSFGPKTFHIGKPNRLLAPYAVTRAKSDIGIRDNAPSETYTASFAFFEALWEAGMKYCFVNLGSDHPAIMEAFVKSQNERPNQSVRIITCPHEMVALSMADGYARLTGKPQCVLVHVDVGTQGLGAAVHDASQGRCPVLIFAGLTPFTIEGESKGSRTEYIHALQDPPHGQQEIIRQYCRFTGEIKTGKNIKQVVNRALSFALSAPQGPAYIMGAREVMEETIEPYKLNQDFWKPIEPAALRQDSVERISQALIEAEEPLIITGYSGRNPECPGELVKLADNIPGLRVLDTAGSDMSFPATHPGWLGVRYGVDSSIETADLILVVDCDVPWINTLNKPKQCAKIFHIDADPLKQMIGTFYIDAVARYRVDSYTALNQINTHIAQSQHIQSTLKQSKFKTRKDSLEISHRERLATIHTLAQPGADGSFGAPYCISELRKACPPDTFWVVEAVTLTGQVSDQLQASLPGHYINCGGGGLGWSGGAALGLKLASMSSDWQQAGAERKEDVVQAPTFVCQIVGDGTYLFSVPSSVYWISHRYKIPILTIVLNNRGWNAPKRSLLLVHPNGVGSKASNEELNISFSPTPDYAGIAKAAAAGNIWAGHTSKADEWAELLREAVDAVKSGKSAVLEAQLDGPSGVFGGGIEGKAT